jgi:hypothetical protein
MAIGGEATEDSGEEGGAASILKPLLDFGDNRRYDRPGDEREQVYDAVDYQCFGQFLHLHPPVVIGSN